MRLRAEAECQTEICGEQTSRSAAQNINPLFKAEAPKSQKNPNRNRCMMREI